MSTYPNECWPADVAIEALDGTTDVHTGLPYIPKGTGPMSVPSYEVQYNRRMQRLNHILGGWRQGMVVDEGDLKIGVYPLLFVQGGTAKAFAGATGVSVPDDSNKVVYLDSAAVLQLADTWPADITTYLPLAMIGTASGQMEITDYRNLTVFHVPSLDIGTVKDRTVVTAHRASVGSGESDTAIFAFDPPGELVLEEVQVYCSAVTSSASVEVKESGVSVLSSPAVPSAGAVVKPAVSDGAIAGSNAVTVHVTTDGTGTVSDLTVTLLFKVTPAG